MRELTKNKSIFELHETRKLLFLRHLRRLSHSLTASHEHLRRFCILKYLFYYVLTFLSQISAGVRHLSERASLLSILEGFPHPPCVARRVLLGRLA